MEFGRGRILEAGHQPNFLPYPGVWRKAFLLTTMNGVPLFGFHDLNVCNSKYLFQNRIPAINKNGFVTIGLKFRKKEVSINAVKKPSENEWQEVMKKIERFYGDTAIIDDLWKAYEFGDSLADVNAIAFARISFKMGIRVGFFRYSDVLKYFEDEWEDIVSRINERMYWYRCKCGGMTFGDVCPVCGRKNFLYPVPNAILRHLLFFEGLKTSVFVSGEGGLGYGKVADEMAKKLGLNRPKTICWICNDFYLNAVRRKILKDLTKMFGIDRFERGSMEEMIKRRSEMSDPGRRKYSETLIEMAKNVFKLKPSILDLIESVGIEEIVKKWHEALKDAEIKRHDSFLLIKKDIDYDGSSSIFEELIGCSNVS